MNPKFFSLLGLAMRAGKVVSGEEQVMRAIRNHKVYLVIVAEDASVKTVKRIRDKGNFYGVPCMMAGTRQQLGQAIGKPERVLLAVTDKGFAEALAQYDEVHFWG